MKVDIDINGIKKVIPHRYPFLLVDRIIEMEEKRIVGIKNLTINEHFFQGHFPGHPIMPGVLIVEALAQAFGVLVLSKEEYKGKFAYFASISNARFRKPVFPGDRLILEVEAVKCRTRVVQAHGVAKVNDSVVCETDFLFSIAEV